MKKFFFRVDSGDHIGIGHLMRCLTLASELKNAGHKVAFITKDHSGYNKKLIQDFSTFVLSGGRTVPLAKGDEDNYKEWLGNSWEEDLRDTNLILSSEKPDMVIVDNYSLDVSYEQQLRCRKILIIDDLMNRKHFCNILLDQNLSADSASYKSLVPINAILLLGLQYAIIRREFVEERNKLEFHGISINKILVFFGSSDIGNDCLKLAEALTITDLEKYQFTFILNEDHPTYSRLLEWAASCKSVRILGFIKNMAAVIAEHDFVIGAGGSTSWERVVLGKPSAILSVADNQVKVSKSLEENKLAYYLGKGKEFTTRDWKNFFSRRLPNLSPLQEMSSRCLSVMDGKGVLRIVREMESQVNSHDHN